MELQLRATALLARLEVDKTVPDIAGKSDKAQTGGKMLAESLPGLNGSDSVVGNFPKSPSGPFFEVPRVQKPAASSPSSGPRVRPP